MFSFHKCMNKAMFVERIAINIKWLSRWLELPDFPYLTGSPVFLHIILMYVPCHFAWKLLFSLNLPYFLLLNLATLQMVEILPTCMVLLLINWNLAISQFVTVSWLRDCKKFLHIEQILHTHSLKFNEIVFPRLFIILLFRQDWKMNLKVSVGVWVEWWHSTDKKCSSE